MAAAPCALAYMGPGAGLSMLSSLVAVIGVVLLALVGVVLLPFRLLLKWIRRRGETVEGRERTSSGTRENT
jgi:hypothetical protein